MKRHRHLLWMSLAGMALTACAANRPVIRNEMALKGQPSLTLDGLTISAKLLDLAGIRKDPRLSKTVVVKAAGLLPTNVSWTLVDPPAFELRVLNRTGHVVRLHDAVIKLMDNAGNLYDPLSPATARAELDDAFAAARGRGWEITPDGAAQLGTALSQVKFLSENAQLLPDIAETFIVAFSGPHDHTEEGLNNWLALQSALRLKIFEVPTGTNEAGVVTKRVAFEFPFVVRTFRDTREVGPDGKEKLVSVEVQK